jgi:hypothetical protein
VDFAPAQQLLSCLHKQQELLQGTQEQPAQQQTVAQQLEFMLTVSFPVTSGGSSSHIPVLQLKSPSWFTAQLPALSLPAWDPHTSLLEYLPHLAERVTKHLADHCPTAANRFLLFEGLSRLLGPPLELNMSLLQASSSSSSASFGAAAGLAGAWQGRSPVAAGSAAGMWHVLYDSPLLLFVALPRNYPADAPVLCLQNLRWVAASSRFLVWVRLLYQTSLTLSNYVLAASAGLVHQTGLCTASVNTLLVLCVPSPALSYPQAHRQ